MVDTLLGNSLFLAVFGAISPCFYYFPISCCDWVPGAPVCPRGLTSLFDDRMVATILGKNCFLAVLGAYVSL